MYLFFLLWLLYLGLPELCWIIVVEVDTLVLFLILGGMLSVFTIRNNVCCRFIIYGLYYVEVGSFSVHFLKSFNHKFVLNFVKRFSSSIEIIIRFLSLSGENGESIPPKIRNKTWVFTFTTIIQHHFGSASYSNQRRKRNKRHPDQKRSKALTVCRWHDMVHIKP